jgi:DNA polymerase-3 subunit alpha
MPHSDFVHLTVHTAYSLAEGAIQVKNLIKNCQKNQMPAVAVTDTGNLFGALEFSVLAAEAGVQPIIGVKINVTRNSITSTNLRKNILDKIVLIAKNEVGYKNLLDLVSTSFTESDGSELPQISMADLEDKNDGLIAFSAGISGVIGRLILEEKKRRGRGSTA